ncbi:hopanoid biosynthesis associated glycosyl transferase protein HpnI [Synechococcus sp. PCC 7502]|uniref:bacteriohopanetetrol glucosamine biosynthesis glycosyltransferase HpnI n=1 Tax=Synechococcus sp. PCC 7502 TaxID=1173263 RepID=UPI00029F9B4E|nr:bacteriohopanetetrol glucosamine biosynthesis glycosyltransferase HpnI [Synechococcus sp. PCC 7502]AFY73313.1 hopanoid biosynthesis associated glycosyl transferase protein HpnI [Synechococcus sp. PCC 7502]
MDFLGLIFCLPATVYACYGIYAAIAFFKNPYGKYALIQKLDYLPPITILKPVCGLDPEIYLNFASFCTQNYPKYQLIFAVSDPNDPVIAVVKQIIHDFPSVDFPHLDIELVQNDRLIGTNYKISNLANALPMAKYETLVLADSDVRVDPEYLQTLVQPLADPRVGAVTCLYRPIMNGWVATLEAVGISTDYLSSVLVANQLEGIKFALGTTIAIKKTVLAEIGGFEAIAAYLADDYQIGYLTSQLGYKVVLSHYIIDHFISTNNFPELLDRQLRWAYCTKVSRPWGYLGLFFTQGIATSLIFLLISGGSGWGWVGLAIAWISRMILAWVVAVWGLKDRTASKFLWLVPIRDLLSFGIWLYSWFSNSMNWRGRRLKLSDSGKLVLNDDLND